MRRSVYNWKWNDPWLLLLSIKVFLYKLWSSAIKGHFQWFFVSSIILTSLSSILTRSIRLFLSSFLTTFGCVTCSSVPPFLFSDYIILQNIQFCKSALYTNLQLEQMDIKEKFLYSVDGFSNLWYNGSVGLLIGSLFSIRIFQRTPIHSGSASS